MQNSTIVDLRELWDTLNSETMVGGCTEDTWDDYVCCVGGYSD